MTINNHKIFPSDKQINYFQIASSLKIDFTKLSINSDNELWKQVLIFNGKITIDFHNQKSLIKLTQAIMKQIFNIKWSINQNNLCPRIPNRVNYLMWLHKFVQPLIVKQGNVIDSVNNNMNKKEFKFLDIGTGGSLIYPLLGYRIFGWKFIATQISQQSIQNCNKLIKINSLQQHITVIKSNTSHFLKDTIRPDQRIKILLSNPPFFDTQSWNLPPLSIMKQNQHNAIGGEYDFFFKIYMQSFYYLNIEYFTLMIGLQKDFIQIKKFLNQQYQSYKILEMIRFGQLNQGQNVRFVVCWRVKRQQKNQIISE